MTSGPVPRGGFHPKVTVMLEVVSYLSSIIKLVADRGAVMIYKLQGTASDRSKLICHIPDVLTSKFIVLLARFGEMLHVTFVPSLKHF